MMRTRTLLYALMIPLFCRCGLFLNRTPQVLVSAVVLHPDYEPIDVVYRPSLSEPCRFEVELRCGLDSVQLFSPVRLEQISDSLRISIIDLPLCWIWTAEPVERIGQRDIDYVKMEPDITIRDDDKLNGNRIRYWNLTPLIKQGQKLEICRRFQFTGYCIDFDIDSSKVGPYQKDRPFYRFYTQSERWLEYEGAIADTAAKIIADERNPYMQALRLFIWIQDHATYHYPPTKRGAREMLATMQGDCGQYAYLFIALCRSVGIPSRLVSGFQLTKENTWSYHAWAECFLPRYGWVPADLTEDCDFGQLPNNRLIASVGMNIPLSRAPSWANYHNSDLEQGVTDFMQMATMCYAGLAARRFADIQLIKAKGMAP